MPAPAAAAAGSLKYLKAKKKRGTYGKFAYFADSPRVLRGTILGIRVTFLEKRRQPLVLDVFFFCVFSSPRKIRVVEAKETMHTKQNAPDCEGAFQPSLRRDSEGSGNTDKDERSLLVDK